jgi:hypothetical protein
VLVDGQVVVPVSVDGSRRSVTLPFAPVSGSIVEITYFFNNWQNTFDDLPDLGVVDIVLIDGKPIGDCSVSEVRAWAARRDADRRAAGRDVQFALNLVANLPAGTVIREHWAPMLNDVDKMYDRAEAEHAA